MTRRTASRLSKLCIGVACILILSSTCWAANAESTSAGPLENKEPGKGETSIGCLVADSFRAAMHSEVAFVSAGDLKPSTAAIESGKVRSGDVAALLTYPDEPVVVVALDGRMIREALERSVSSLPRSGQSFLQVSGCKVVFDPSRSGGRIVSIEIGGKPLVNEQAYTVAMPNSLAGGALGYWKVWSKRNIVSGSASVTCTIAVDRYFKTNPKLDYSTLNRVTAVAK